MKKIFSIAMLILLTLLVLNVPKVHAASNPVNIGIKSPKYNNSSDNDSSYDHIGYYGTESYNWSNTTKWNTYGDLYIKKTYKVSFAGILGTPQATYYKEYPAPIIYTGPVISVDQLSFFMNESLIHTNTLTFGVEVEVNDIKSSMDIAFTRTTRYTNGIKITTDVGENTTGAPLVALVVYKIEGQIKEIRYDGTSIRNWIWESWPSSTYTRSTSFRTVTIGYVGYYTYLGDGNDNDYKNGNYLINNHPNFNSSVFKTYL